MEKEESTLLITKTPARGYICPYCYNAFIRSERKVEMLIEKNPKDIPADIKDVIQLGIPVDVIESMFSGEKVDFINAMCSNPNHKPITMLTHDAIYHDSYLTLLKKGYVSLIAACNVPTPWADAVGTLSLTTNSGQFGCETIAATVKAAPASYKKCMNFTMTVNRKTAPDFHKSGLLSFRTNGKRSIVEAFQYLVNNLPEIATEERSYPNIMEFLLDNIKDNAVFQAAFSSDETPKN